ncbi:MULTISPECIES: hypothetical protein [unclassified Nocardia]|uniref:hypothetical protein n=1 Tax=unclassified Nocardia TaxID=2637762 RepID=UPI001CE407C9|nr:MULTISPECIES: hypothetical protein [unclassified Nocardia]
MSDAAELLSRTLSAPLPAEFDRLSEAELAQLDRLLRAAEQRRADRLGAAIDSGLRLIPRLMRPAVKRALGL